MRKIKDFLDKHLITLLTLISLGLFVGSFIFYFHQHETLLYGDGKSRLLIARRVFDSLTPGLAQFGAVWPPFPQTLFLLSAWNDFLFYSGLSGSMVSIIFGSLTVYFLSKMVLDITKSKIITAAAALVVMLNPSFLYMVTTPMTEVIFIGLFVTSAYFVWRWSITEKIVYLPLSGLVLIAATLTRYDGWFLAVLSTFLISAVAFFRHRSFAEMHGHFFLFTTVAFSGIIGWLIYNRIIYGNFFIFALEASPAGNQSMTGLLGVSVAASTGNIIYSTFNYFSAVILNVGILSLIAIFLAPLLIVVKNKFKLLVPIFILFTPIWFNIGSLYLGQSALLADNSQNPALFNTRFGLAIVPLVAVSYALLASLSRRYGYLFLVVALIQIGILSRNVPIVLKEVIISQNSHKVLERQKVSSWILDHPTKGLIMVSGFNNDPLIFDARLPLNHVVYEGSGEYWQTATKDPGALVDRIIVSLEERDSVCFLMGIIRLIQGNISVFMTSRKTTN
jgi:hypothetical protein